MATKVPTNAPVVIAGTPAPTVTPVIRINAGGKAFTDTAGKQWQADDFFLSGSPYNAGIEAALDNGVMYSTERYFNIWVHPQPFLYEIPVPAVGEYATILYFMESYWQSAGQRVFDVWVEGSLFVNSLDIVAEVGHKQPLILDTTTMVTDGSLTIEFVAQVENPKISGIEVMDISQYSPPTEAPTVSFAPSAAPSISTALTTSPAPSATPAWKNIHINCGGQEYISNDGLVTWQADAYFTGGGVYVDGSNDIAPTADDPLFHSERHGTFMYEIPVGVGNYEITVHLAEL